MNDTLAVCLSVGMGIALTAGQGRHTHVGGADGGAAA